MVPARLVLCVVRSDILFVHRRSCCKMYSSTMSLVEKTSMIVAYLLYSNKLLRTQYIKRTAAVLFDRRQTESQIGSFRMEYQYDIKVSPDICPPSIHIMTR